MLSEDFLKAVKKNKDKAVTITIEEEEEMDLKSLEVAIKEFDDWEGPASIYYSKKEKYFYTVVYFNGISQAESFLSNQFVKVFHKGEFDNFKINEKRKRYIIEFAKMVDKGYRSDEIEYYLIEPGIYL